MKKKIIEQPTIKSGQCPCVMVLYNIPTRNWSIVISDTRICVANEPLLLSVGENFAMFLYSLSLINILMNIRMGRSKSGSYGA